MTDYFGYSTRSISNHFFTLDVLDKAGPRIVRLIPAGTKLNLLAEVPTIHWPSPGGEFYPLGGHRLWAGPEFPEITYLPDHHSAELEEISNGFRIVHVDQYQQTHYQRQMEIELSQTAPKVTLKHQIKNLNKEPMHTLPWAITQFRLGGKVHFPLTKLPVDPGHFLPNRNLVLWPYTNFHDDRLHLENAGIEIDARPKAEALKIGIFCKDGWTGIEFAEGWTLIKRFAVLQPEDYSDFNSNAQCYVKDAFIELETLGKLGILHTGESATLIEEWEVQKGSLASLGLI